MAPSVVSSVGWSCECWLCLQCAANNVIIQRHHLNLKVAVDPARTLVKPHFDWLLVCTQRDCTNTPTIHTHTHPHPFTNTIMAFFGKSRVSRFAKIQTNAPGPGHYEVSSAHSALLRTTQCGATFTSTGRFVGSTDSHAAEVHTPTLPYPATPTHK